MQLVLWLLPTQNFDDSHFAEEVFIWPNHWCFVCVCISVFNVFYYHHYNCDTMTDCGSTSQWWKVTVQIFRASSSCSATCFVSACFPLRFAVTQLLSMTSWRKKNIMQTKSRSISSMLKLCGKTQSWNVAQVNNISCEWGFLKGETTDMEYGCQDW